MKIFFLLIIINFLILNGNPNLYLTFEVVEADDCISRVHFFGNNSNLYYKDISDPDNNCNHDKQINDKLIVKSVPYEVGKKLLWYYMIEVEEMAIKLH